MKTIPSVLLFVLLAWPAAAAPVKTLKVGEKPESVARGFGDKLYITMINADEPGDGAINVLEGDESKVFAKGFNAPKGLAFVGGFLVTADEKTVWKVDAQGKATVLAAEKDFPQPIEFLNDVAASLDGKSVYVTEMSSPKPWFDPSGERKLWALDSEQAKALDAKGCVYRITLEGKISLAVPPGDRRMLGPNGVTVTRAKGKEMLVMGDFFTGNIVSYLDGKMDVLATGLRGADAVEVGEETLYVSSWPLGKVWAVDRKTKKATVLREGMTTAADFYFDRKARQLIIPDMLEGTLTFLPLK